MVVPAQRQIATTPPEPPAAKIQAQPAQAAPPTPANRDNRSDAATAAAPAAPAASVASVAAPMLQKSAREAFAAVEIASPNSSRRWRLVPAGVEFSTDQGASWIPVRANPTETLTNGISPSGTICWLFGKAGVVLVTADGSIFAKVDLPVRVDVVAMTAADARSATATTADGRTFRTDDSGRNWRQN
jgi:photosystem II stability/assembly factor-like uncharacterized protein